MEQFNDKNEFDQTFESFRTIDFKDADKEEVYTKLKAGMELSEKKSSFFKLYNNILTTAVIAMVLCIGGYFIVTEVIFESTESAPNPYEALLAKGEATMNVVVIIPDDTNSFGVPEFIEGNADHPIGIKMMTHETFRNDYPEITIEEEVPYYLFVDTNEIVYETSDYSQAAQFYADTFPESKDDNITTIETVLMQQFENADQELIDLLDAPENNTIIGKDEQKTPKSPTGLEQYLEGKYSSYFTADMYSEYIVNYALAYQLAAFDNNYHLQVDFIEITEEEGILGSYDFTAYVIYNKERDEQQRVQITGRAGVNSEGKINHINFTSDGGLLEVLSSGS
ncbi:hypothetical protein [Radiobacillus sp. PE A8.2]|uniref:hypothetical protein n=1 Tax=Radiobacillus sp. PE A8.2 TaxID=3380349 RepID=UPI00388D7A7E